NLTSVFRVTREVLTTGGMREASWGRIINIASAAGKQGVVLGAPYSASKHGVVGFTKALGNELAPTGITVNAVCPGYVETPMAEAVRQRYAQAWQISEDEVLAKFQAKIPLGRYSTPKKWPDWSATSPPRPQRRSLHRHSTSAAASATSDHHREDRHHAADRIPRRPPHHCRAGPRSPGLRAHRRRRTVAAALPTDPPRRTDRTPRQPGS